MDREWLEGGGIIDQRPQQGGRLADAVGRWALQQGSDGAASRARNETVCRQCAGSAGKGGSTLASSTGSASAGIASSLSAADTPSSSTRCGPAHHPSRRVVITSAPVRAERAASCPRCQPEEPVATPHKVGNNTKRAVLPPSSCSTGHHPTLFLPLTLGRCSSSSSFTFPPSLSAAIEGGRCCLSRRVSVLFLRVLPPSAFGPTAEEAIHTVGQGGTSRITGRKSPFDGSAAAAPRECAARRGVWRGRLLLAPLTVLLSAMVPASAGTDKSGACFKMTLVRVG